MPAARLPPAFHVPATHPAHLQLTHHVGCPLACLSCAPATRLRTHPAAARPSHVRLPSPCRTHPQVTHHVVCLARWMAADLYLREVDALRFELSMSSCSAEVRLINPRFNQPCCIKHKEKPSTEIVACTCARSTRCAVGRPCPCARPSASPLFLSPFAPGVAHGEARDPRAPAAPGGH